ncbi:polysaccharide deacetylase family protein [Halomarina rubra]|uniref:Polysaccharide deacetylase family protein n=1 Tax=Halomarina rubra TaxID=2071873 RepID=A0ABD6AWV5_9EURY|nr:polysaccharide deacetylase family protein [Halomarina rubra]
MRAVMYHYVRPDLDRPPGGYYRMDREDFRAQLDHLESEYDLLGRDRLLAVVRGERRPPDDGVVLTFDDGLVDHHEWVLPELRERGLSGVFFVSTGPLDGDVLAVHRAHALLGAVPADEVHDALLETLVERGLSPETGESADTYGDTETGATDHAAVVKRLVNFELPVDSVPSVLDAVERRLSVGPLDPEAFYLTDDDLGDLRDAGMVLGAHTVTHRVLSRLSPQTQRTEVRESFDRLERVVGPLEERLFAYPYGGPETYTATTRSILEEADCTAAFTTVSGEIDVHDVVTRPLELPRMDCNEFPHGSASFRM